MKSTPPEPSRTRTNNDPIMIILGVLLITLFLFSVFVSVNFSELGAKRIRGPVKDPKIGGVSDHRYSAQNHRSASGSVQPEGCVWS
jgi:hypothetical protein